MKYVERLEKRTLLFFDWPSLYDPNLCVQYFGYSGEQGPNIGTETPVIAVAERHIHTYVEPR